MCDEDAAVPQTAAFDGDPAAGAAADPAPILSSTPIRITRDEARLLAVAAQGLDRRPPARVPRDKGLVLATIRALGCVQLDTISVISRSHETVLWSRLGPFDPSLVWELFDPDGALIEHWLHAAAIAPVEFFPYLRRLMVRRAADEWAAANREVLDRVLAAIAARGPLQSRHFERPDGPKPPAWSWYGGKPERQALDALWSSGELVILRRDGFQRVYELTERRFPGLRDGAEPSSEAQRRFFTGRALRALGVATPRWVADYFRTGGRPHVPPADAAAELRALAEDGLAIPVAIEGLSGPAWLSQDALAKLDDLRSSRGRPVLTTLLSPFDSLTWHRGRTTDLFAFDFRLECYTPAPKRRYGYYNLSILHRGRLVGRLDPSYDRRSGLLSVRALHLEPGIRPTEPLAAAVAGALRDLLAFLGGRAVTILASDPSVFGPLVQHATENGEHPPPPVAAPSPDPPEPGRPPLPSPAREWDGR